MVGLLEETIVVPGLPLNVIHIDKKNKSYNKTDNKDKSFILLSFFSFAVTSSFLWGGIGIFQPNMRFFVLYFPYGPVENGVIVQKTVPSTEKVLTFYI